MYIYLYICMCVWLGCFKTSDTSFFLLIEKVHTFNSRKFKKDFVFVIFCLKLFTASYGYHIYRCLTMKSMYLKFGIPIRL